MSKKNASKHTNRKPAAKMPTWLANTLNNMGWVMAFVVARVLLSFLGMALETGTMCLAFQNDLDAIRTKWLVDFSVTHYVLEGILAYAFVAWAFAKLDESNRLLVIRGGMFLVIAVTLLAIEGVAYLAQFCGYATYVAVVNWVAEVTVPNMVSLPFLFSRISLARLLWESVIIWVFMRHFCKK